MQGTTRCPTCGWWPPGGSATQQALENDRLVRENAGLEARLGRIRAQLLTWFDDHGDIEAVDFQEALVTLGLLAPVEATESCGEGCQCAEYDDFPVTCYRPTGVSR